MVQFCNVLASSSVVLSVLLLQSGDAASTVGRKRIALDTAFARPKDSFGLERNLEVPLSFGMFGSMSSCMSMSMSMSMCMSMSMDLGFNFSPTLPINPLGFHLEKDEVHYYDENGNPLSKVNFLVSGNVDNGVVDNTGGAGNGVVDNNTDGADNGAVDSTGGAENGVVDSTGGTDSGVVGSTTDTVNAGGEINGGTDNAGKGSVQRPHDETTANPSSGDDSTASSTAVVSDSGATTESSGAADRTPSSLVSTAHSRSCSSESSLITFEQPGQYHREVIIPYSYKIETSHSHGKATRKDLEKVGSAVLDTLAPSLLACVDSSSERMLMVQRLLAGDLQVSSIEAHSDFADERCNPTNVNSGHCAVVVGTIDLSVDDSSVPADDLTEATLSMVKDNMYSLASSIEGVTNLAYVPIVHEVTIDTSSKPDKQDTDSSLSNADESGASTGASISETTTSSSSDENDISDREYGDVGTFSADNEVKGDNGNSGSGGAVAGVLVAGACAAVIAGVVLARRRRNASSIDENELLGIEPRDLESPGESIQSNQISDGVALI